ncbi:MAG: hypothetical protein AB7F98_03305, partial [Novosphingobium sp.]
MKKLVAYAATVGMAMSVNLALPTAATAQGASPAAEFCQANYEAVGFESVGDCVSALRTNIV